MPGNQIHFMSTLLKLKHAISVAGMIYPKDTIVEKLDAAHPLVQQIFPEIQSNPNSTLVAVKFPGRDHATIGLAKSFYADMV